MADWLIIMKTITVMLMLMVFVCYIARTSVHAEENKTMNVICYFLNGYGTTIAPPEALDPNLCTHIFYAFVTLDVSGNLTHQRKSVDIDNEMYKRVIALKKVNPKLKILASVTNDADVFSEVAADSSKKEIFANSAINYCQTHGFDGLDIDWEKPDKSDADNFVDMLKKLRTALDTGGWLLSIAAFPYPSVGYNVPGIVKYVHMINIMCYNFYGSWSAYTGYNSALFMSSAESNYEKTRLNVAVSITNWIEAGVPKDKINVGIPFYGRTFTLVNPDDHGFHAPIIGAGSPSTPSYKTICSTFTNYTTVWDDEQKVPYKYYKDQWLSYEDERSIEEKTKYIALQKVAGIMIWQIGLDDVKGECGPKQGLLRVVNNNLNPILDSTI